MELLKLNEVNLTNLDTKFKQSPVGKLVASIIVLGLLIMFVTFYFVGKMELKEMLIATGICFFILLFAVGSFIKNIAPSAWNLGVSSRVVYIKFRSFFNSHFPEDDPQVLSLPFSEIKSVGATKQKLKYKGACSNGTTIYQTFLDITVNGIDLTSLKKQLEYEYTCKGSKNATGVTTKFCHDPVRVIMPDTIRVGWYTRNTQLKPGIKKTVEMLEQEGLRVEELKKEVIDYTETDSMPEGNIDAMIRDLAITESKLAAISMARKKYGYGLKEAKDYVDKLMEEKAV